MEPPPVCKPRSPLTVPTSIEPPPVSALMPPPMSSTLMPPPPLSASSRPAMPVASHRAAFRFKLHPASSRGESSRKTPPERVARPSAPLPVPDDPGGIALHIRSDLVLLELVPCFLLRRISEMSMNDIINGLLLPAANDYGAHVDFHSQVPHRCQRAGDLLTPSSAFAGYVCFLRFQLFGTTASGTSRVSIVASPTIL